MWEQAFIHKPRRRASTKVTVGAMPPDLPPKSPRRAWWKDLSFWPGSGLVGSRQKVAATSSDDWATSSSLDFARRGGVGQASTVTTRPRESSSMANWACRGRKKQNQFKKVEPEGSWTQNLYGISTSEPHSVPPFREEILLTSASSTLAHMHPVEPSFSSTQSPEKVAVQFEVSRPPSDVSRSGSILSVPEQLVEELRPTGYLKLSAFPAPFLRAQGSRRNSVRTGGLASQDLQSLAPSEHLELDLSFLCDDLPPEVPSSASTSPANRSDRSKKSKNHSRTSSPFGSDFSSEGEKTPRSQLKIPACLGGGSTRSSGKCFSGSSSKRATLAANKYTVGEDKVDSRQVAADDVAAKQTAKSNRLSVPEAGTGSDALSALFGDDGKLLSSTPWSNSYVSCATSLASDSRRSSARVSQLSSRRSSDGDVHQGSIIPEEEEHLCEGSRIFAEQLEQWRSDFPLEVLDLLAEFYESSPVNSYTGHRIIDLTTLDQLAANAMGCPPEVVIIEATVRNPALAHNGNNPLQFPCASFAQFLELLRAVVHRVELELPHSLWSEDDVRHIEDIFHRHAAGSARMPMARLFNAVYELDFAGLAANSPQQQEWWAGLARMVIRQEVEARRRAVHNAAHLGSLSLHELIRILSAALLDLERSERRAAYRNERKAIQETQFSTREAEDLRELYATYSGITVANNHAFARLLKLFECCGINSLSSADMATLRSIVQQTLKQDVGPVTFDIFLHWMRFVFQHKIGGMQIPSRRPSEDMSEETHEVPASTMDNEAKGFLGLVMREQRNALCAGLRQKPTEAGRHSRWSTRPSNQASRKGSKNRTRVAPRGASRSNSRSNSIGSSTSVKSASQHAANQHIFSLKGLPPSEAMLARKKFRANSMDASADMEASEGGKGVDSLKQSTVMDPVLSRLQTELCSSSSACPKSGKTGGNFTGMRQEKPAVDPKSVVADAIAKLSELSTS